MKKLIGQKGNWGIRIEEVGLRKCGVVEDAADDDDEDKDDDEDEVHLKCGGVEKDVGRLGDVCSMHAVVVRNVLVKMIMMMIMTIEIMRMMIVRFWQKIVGYVL